MGNKTALIIGVSGQDGSYLAEYLLGKGYEIHAVVRRSANEPRNHSYLGERIQIHHADLCHDLHIVHLIAEIKPDEIYNLAAQSDVGISFEDPEYTGDINALGVLRLLEAIRYYSPGSKFYQASTSELFGSSPPPQNEDTPMDPQSPYAAAKLFAYNMIKIYRKAYGIFACNGILFNHESLRRGLNFVTRKITRAVANIYFKKQSVLLLGNLEAKRDWGYAGDYVEAMWLMLQQDKPDDYVVGTGESHTVREFCELAFNHVGLDYRDYVIIDSRFFRPAEVNYLCANPAKAKQVLGWYPKTSFEELVYMMVDADIKSVSREIREEIKA